MAKKTNAIKRYFVIGFTATVGGMNVNSQVVVSMDNGKFPSYSTICRFATNQLLDEKANPIAVAITMIFEFASKEDFDSFIGNPKNEEHKDGQAKETK